MTMSIEQGLIMIVCAALGTVITRFLPFILFPDNKPTPEIVNYLGKILPFSVIGLLVVYCLKNVSLLAFPFGLPELISIVIIVLLHIWKKNSLLSIAAGTVAYMALLQFVFV